ncbi:ribosome maturation factor RimP [Candidatus Fokinia solitaria]|nr:hypothetical protein [Candidatus Fokinia solitaria]
MNYEIVRIRIGNNTHVEILVERVTGEAISIDETAEIARYIKPLLYQGNAILLHEQNFSPANYSYDVSSCGVEKPLTREKDLLRAIGKRVSVKLYRSIIDQNRSKLKKLEGELLKLTDTAITIQYNSAEINVPFDNISDIILVYIPWKTKK